MKIKLVTCFFLIIIGINTIAQKTDNTPRYNFSNGLGIVAPDSLFSINFRFRTQLRASYNTISTNNFSASEIEARVRRLRLRAEGFIINTKLNYYIQLSFSRADMDWEQSDNNILNSSPNIVRDAVFIYKPNDNLAITFGQTKLPGNRQRVVSSGNLQFADRSIVNAIFNIDRDFGIQMEYQNKLAAMHYVIKTAISSGEGRNATSRDAGMAYTGRLEILPMGEFTNGGDYFEGDLEREKTPKLSIAGGYHYNENAMRVAGTLGKDLYQSRSLSYFITDVLFKYKGLALSAEYINRNTPQPITTNAANQERYVYVGNGKMMQVSYLFSNNLEIAARYASTTPNNTIYKFEPQKTETGIGVTKYLRKHKVKLQGQLFYNQNKSLITNKMVNHFFNGTFQIELGI